MRKRHSKKNDGFSLVELIVVVAIMATLVVILAPVMLRYVEKTRLQKDESALSEVVNAAELAVGEESISSAIDGTPDIVLTITESGIADNGLYVHGSAGNLIADEVKKTVGNGIQFASKTYSNGTATVYVKLIYDSGRHCYVFAKTATGKPFATSIAELNY